MTKKVFSIVLGVLFGIYLIGYTYFSFIMGVVISLKFKIDITFIIFAFPILGIITIVGAGLTKKNIVLTRIFYSISTLFYLAFQVLLFTLNIYSQFSVTVLLFIAFALIGIAATIHSFTIKNCKIANQTQQNQ